MTELEALTQIADHLHDIQGSMTSIGIALWLMLLFKNMSGGD